MGGRSLVGGAGEGLEGSERTLLEGEKSSLLSGTFGSLPICVMFLTYFYLQLLMGLLAYRSPMARSLLLYSISSGDRADF